MSKSITQYCFASSTGGMELRPEVTVSAAAIKVGSLVTVTGKTAVLQATAGADLPLILVATEWIAAGVEVGDEYDVGDTALLRQFNPGDIAYLRLKTSAGSITAGDAIKASTVGLVDVSNGTTDAGIGYAVDDVDNVAAEQLIKVKFARIPATA